MPDDVNEDRFTTRHTLDSQSLENCRCPWAMVIEFDHCEEFSSDVIITVGFVGTSGQPRPAISLNPYLHIRLHIDYRIL